MAKPCSKRSSTLDLVLYTLFRNQSSVLLCMELNVIHWERMLYPYFCTNCSKLVNFLHDNTFSLPFFNICSLKCIVSSNTDNSVQTVIIIGTTWQNHVLNVSLRWTLFGHQNSVVSSLSSVCILRPSMPVTMETTTQNIVGGKFRGNDWNSLRKHILSVFLHWF